VLKNVEDACHYLIGCYPSYAQAEAKRENFRFDYCHAELYPEEQFSIMTSDRLAPFMDL
jgi:hypothetical protein